MPHCRCAGLPQTILIAILLLCVTMTLPVRSAAQTPIRISLVNPDTITELFAYLDSCVPFVPGSQGSELTLRFSLTHEGALRGPPMVTYASLKGSLETQRHFVTTMIDALGKCMPIPMTDQFGKIASTKMILWRVHATLPTPNKPRLQSI